MKYKVNQEGFITNYLVAGPWVTDFDGGESGENRIFAEGGRNQLEYEQHLRTLVAKEEEPYPGVAVPMGETGGDVRMGETGGLPMPWRYYYRYGSWFVDESTFYSTLKKWFWTA